MASVSSDGVVTARGAGNTRIVCKTGSGKSIKLNVNVVSVMSQEEQDKSYEEKITKEYDANGDLVPSMVKFAEESAGVQVGQKVLLDARIYPAGAKYTYTIESDNPSVVNVNRKGEITGIKEGNAANFVVFDAKNLYDALNYDVSVLYSYRNGKLVAETKPKETTVHY